MQNPILNSHRAFRAQSSMEMLVMVGFAIAFIIPLALLFFSISSTELGKSSLLQAKASVRIIAEEAGSVYLQGNGSRKTIVVNYPEGVLNGSLSDGLVRLRVSADGRENDITSYTFANITGNLSGRRPAGVQRIKLVNIDGNNVNITYG